MLRGEDTFDRDSHHSGEGGRLVWDGIRETPACNRGFVSRLVNWYADWKEGCELFVAGEG
jgi:hypothetical protein